jgi:sec-independent protein translocase protein TatB
MTFLFILDSVGNTELLLILVAALIFFGPRRLPQLSRQIGRSLSEFRRASDDFKRTWEREVNLETYEQGFDSQQEPSIFDKASDRIRSAREAAAGEMNFEDSEKSPAAPVITPVDPSLTEPRNATSEPETAAAEQPKHEWL